MSTTLAGKQWLIVSPHADDAELGMGGLMARAAAQGIQLHVVIACIKGEKQHHNGYVSGTTRYDEAQAALALVGAGLKVAYRMAQSEEFDLGTTSKAAFVQLLDGEIARLQPDTVFLPVPSFHQEHQWVYDCGIAATRTTRYQSPIRHVYAYEYPAAGWGPSGAWDASRGGVYADISDHLDTKLAMLAEHKSQMYRGENSLISLEAVKALARYRGIEAGTTHAELMYLLRGAL